MFISKFTTKVYLSFFWVTLFSTFLFSQEIPNDPSVKQGVLDNGLNYYIQENSYPEERASLRLVVKAGSILEDDDQQGLAHLIEHMAFNGTEKYPKNELVHYLESLGAAFGPEINAYTSFDQTVYMLDVATQDPQELYNALEILQQWAFHITFAQEELDKERGVVIEEWRGGRGAHARMLDQGYKDVLHNSHYAERLPIGKPEIIEEVSIETVRRFYNDWYRPDLMGIIAVGAFDSQKLEQDIQTLFGEYTNPSPTREKPFYDIPDHKSIYSLQSDPEAQQPTFYLFKKIPKEKIITEEDYQATLSQYLAQNIINSRIQKNIEKNNTPLTAAQWYTTDLGGPASFSSLAGTGPLDKLNESFNALLKIIEQAKRYGVEDSEIEREKKSLIVGKERVVKENDKRQSARLAKIYTDYFLNQTHFPSPETDLDLTSRLLKNIQTEDINKIINDFSTQTNYTLLFMTPPLPEDNNLSEEALTQLVSELPTVEIAPYHNDAVLEKAFDPESLPLQDVPEPVYDEITGTYLYNLDHDIQVVLKPTEYKNDEILFFARGDGGYSLANDNDYISALLSLGAKQESGLNNYSPSQWQDFLSDKIVSLRPSLSDTERSFSGASNLENSELLMQLLYLQFTQSSISPDGWRRYLNQVSVSLASQRNNPKILYQEMLDKVLYNSHFRSHPITVDRLQEGNITQANEFWHNNFSDASGMQMVFIGSIQPEELKPLIARYILNLPTKQNIKWLNREMRYTTETGTHTLKKGLEPQAQTSFLFPGTWTWSDEERYKIAMMTSMVQVRLREIIREDLSGTYSIGVYPRLSKKPEEQYLMTIRFSTTPDRLEELKQAVKKVIQEEFQTGTEKELYDRLISDLKKQRLRSLEEQEKQNSYWMQMLGHSIKNELPLNTIYGREELIESFTTEDLIRLTKEYFNFDRLLVFDLLPEASNETSLNE